MTIRTIPSFLLLSGIFVLPLPEMAGAATATITIGMGFILGADGNKAGAETLVQLVNLGANGVFDPIPTGAWVGGDDTVIGESFPNSDGWTLAAAFDLTNGTGTTPGLFSRQFTFALGAGIHSGDKIGIRWFPTLAASGFATLTPASGMPYGQFTRQASTLYGGSLWVVPAAGSFVSFDPMVTASFDPVNGKDPDAAGVASALTGLSPIEIWRQSHFGSADNAGNGADMFDFAHDGVVNLVKYAFGLDPTRSNPDLLPKPQLLGGSLVVNYAEPAGVSGVTYGAEWSATLQSDE